MTKNGLTHLALCALVFLAGCASNRTAEVESKPVIKNIAVIPVADPSWYSLKNRNALSLVVSPLIGVAVDLDASHKAKLLNEQMKTQAYSLGSELTKSLISSLNQKGYQVSVLQDVKRPTDDPESLDYASIKAEADAVLHVYFSDVGVYSGYGSVDYLPKVNLEGYLFNPKDGEYLHSETIYYGVDAKEGKSWGVVPDPKFAYRSFDDLIKNPPEVMTGFTYGAHAAAKRMAENIHGALQ